MKSKFLFLVGLLSSVMTAQSALAATDSVGVFHRNDKVIVLVNEKGGAGRLQAFMDVMGASDKLQVLSSDASIKIECGRNATEASCTFRLLPSDNVLIGPGNVVAEAALEGAPQEQFHMMFESSMQDHFELMLRNGRVLIQANKRVRQ